MIQEQQIYLSFLGVALSREDERIIKPCERISFLTQKLLLTSIYEKWKDVSVSKAAERLSVAKISVIRCYDEIEAIRLPYIKKIQIAIVFCKKEMWEQIGDVLCCGKGVESIRRFRQTPRSGKAQSRLQTTTAEKDELYTEYDKL